MGEIEEKIKVIDEIVKRHPSYGVDNGWSYYVGGMRDTGDWYFRKMLDENIEILQSFLSELVHKENMPPKESKISQEEAFKKLHEDIERQLIFGSTNRTIP